MRIRFHMIAALVLAFSLSANAADLATLKTQIEKAIPRARGDVGVAIKHLESGNEVLINADKQYPMASIFKLPLLIELFYQSVEGKLSFEENIELMPSDLHIGSGAIIALFDPPGVQINIRNLINMMMRVSDNSAADILLNRAGIANVTARMKSLGLDSIR
ncbi:MAG TPA: serine hydrolase, partial [Terriglobia bacterium]|nr:serine hydrolase [Terriglobia bacterium]